VPASVSTECRPQPNPLRVCRCAGTQPGSGSMHVGSMGSARALPQSKLPWLGARMAQAKHAMLSSRMVGARMEQDLQMQG